MNEPSATIVWIHGDNLSPHGPSLAAYPDAPALWVWDDALLAEWRISLKRVLFIYECLLELPVSIRRGEVTAELIRFAAEQEATTVVTTDSPSPRFELICDELRSAGLRVEVLADRRFIDFDGPIDLRRFSRYWSVARRSALR